MTGVADETLFIFSCAGWLEWNNDATAPDLRFEYKIAELGMQRFVLFDYNYNVSVTSVHNEHGVFYIERLCAVFRSYLLHYGSEATSTPTVLPMGNPDAHFINEARLNIYDSRGDFFTFLQNVTVRNPTRVRLKFKSFCTS